MSNSNDSGWSTYRRTCVGLRARFLARAGCGKSARPVRRGESGSGFGLAFSPTLLFQEPLHLTNALLQHDHRRRRARLRRAGPRDYRRRPERSRRYHVREENVSRTALRRPAPAHAARAARLSGGQLQPDSAPTHPEADAGFVIMEQVEYPPMSGTNTICVVTVLIETGMVKAVEPVTHLKLETPAGLIGVEAEVRDGKVKKVTFRNVPAFATHL